MFGITGKRPTGIVNLHTYMLARVDAAVVAESLQPYPDVLTASLSSCTTCAACASLGGRLRWFQALQALLPA